MKMTAPEFEAVSRTGFRRVLRCQGKPFSPIRELYPHLTEQLTVVDFREGIVVKILDGPEIGISAKEFSAICLSSDHLHSRRSPVSAERCVQGQQCSTERLGQCQECRIIGGEVLAKCEDPRQ